MMGGVIEFEAFGDYFEATDIFLSITHQPEELDTNTHEETTGQIEDCKIYGWNNAGKKGEITNKKIFDLLFYSIPQCKIDDLAEKEFKQDF